MDRRSAHVREVIWRDVIWRDVIWRDVIRRNVTCACPDRARTVVHSCRLAPSGAASER
jgi:hypothetical protein